MKKVVFKSILFFLLFSLTYFLFGLWGLVEISKNKNLLFKSKENLIFHKNYSNKIHHLRDANRWGDKENGYLFSVINKNNTKDKTILLQGDSWIESISEIKQSEEMIKNFAIKNNYTVYNAGITSFAPSLMHKQYEILKQEFYIKPDLLIIYIDQTDIGDEFCRYKNKKIYSKNGKLKRISREKFTRATYDYSKLYLYSELNFQSTLNKIIKFPVKKINYFLKRNINQLNNILKNGYKNRSVHKCGFKEIMKELENYDSDVERNFKKSLSEFLDYLANERNIEKIFIVSFPHKRHLEKTYSVDVSDYINDTLSLSKDKRINYINMSKIDFSNLNKDEIYKPNDLASHLNDVYHTEIFVKNIIKNIKNKIKN